METQTSSAKRGPKSNPHTRENLIRVGIEKLHTNGYAATGIKDIVEAANIPKGSFYNHFDSKEAFGKEVIAAYFLGGLEELTQLLCDESISPLDRLHNYFEARTNSFRVLGFAQGCLMGNLSLEVADHSLMIRDQLSSNFAEWGKLLENCITEAQKSGAVKNSISSEVLARFLLNSWEGALVRMRVEKDDKAMREFSEVVFKAILT